MITKIKKKIDFKELIKNINIDCLIISILCCLPMSSFIFNIDNFLPFSFLILMVFTLIYKKESVLNINNLKNNKIIIIFYLLIFLFIIINIFIFGLNIENLKRVLYFFVYAILPTGILFTLYISDVKFEFVKIFRYINYFYALFALFIYNDNFWSYPFAERMPMSYYFLPLLLSFFFEIVLDKESTIKQKCIRIAIYTVFYFPYIRFTLRFMSRGAILAFLFCVVCTILTYLNKKQRVLLLIFLIIVSLIVFAFGLDILKFIHNILNELNIYIEFIEKNIRLLESNSLGNGRDVIYKNAIQGIINSPFIGNGIGDFQIMYGIYPHNFILQMIYESGLFYTIFISSPIFYAFFKILFNSNNDIEFKCFYLFIFSLTIIRLLLSFEYWLDLFFWFCLFVSLVFLIKEFKCKKARKTL